MEEKISQIQKEYFEKIVQATKLSELDELFLALFGKKGVLTLLPKDFSQLPKEQLQKVGPAFNQTKVKMEKAIRDKRKEIKEECYKKLADEKLDLTPETSSPPSRKDKKGYLNPLTKFEKDITDQFSKLGFQRYDAPHIDTDYYNFEALNIPPQHPARDLWDTLYIADAQKYGYKAGELLLRTHTSNAQVRAMKKHGIPLRMMIIGSCFRYENTDA